MNRLRQLCGFAFALALPIAFLLALQPVPAVAPLFEHQDKLGHGLVFCTITLLGLMAWPRRVWRIALGMLAYGAAMEVTQSFTTFRQGDLLDWIADAVGIGLACGLLRAAEGRRAQTN